MNFGQNSVDHFEAGGALACGITVVPGAFLQLLVVSSGNGALACGVTVVPGACLQLLVISSGKEVEVFGQGKCMDSGQRDCKELDDK